MTNPMIFVHNYSTYSRGLCKCDVCRAAKAERQRAIRASHDGLPPGDPRHGTLNGYNHWQCRCDACTAAKSRTW